MPVRITWPQALAWRLRRHLLDPVADAATDEVVGQLCGVQAQVASSAELAIRLRQTRSEEGGVQEALADGSIVKTWAMRGTLHLMRSEDAGAFLSLLAASRTWELPSWERYYGMGRREWAIFRPAVREALDGAPLTREELIAAVVERPGLEHIGDALRSGWGSLLKPLAFQGDLCFGPSRGQNVTFMRPEAASARWAGVPEPDEAAPRAILAYLRTYGPATVDAFANFVSRGRVPKRRLRGWFDGLGNSLAEVEVDGECAFVRAEDVDDICATRPADTVRLLGGFDQWVLGPGTDDGHVIPQSRRAEVSKQSGWIAPVVVVGGVVSGTWEIDGKDLCVSWFAEAGEPPRAAIESEAMRIGALASRDLMTSIATRGL